MARNHRLAAAIVIGQFHHLALCGLGADFGGEVGLGAQQGRHGAEVRRHGLLHRLAAQAQQPGGDRHRQGAGCGQGAVFAQGMAGYQGHLIGQAEAALTLQHPHHRHGDGHQRRLGIGGEGQLIGWAFEDQAREFLLQRVIHLLKGFPRDGEGVGQIPAHAG